MQLDAVRRQISVHGGPAGDIQFDTTFQHRQRNHIAVFVDELGGFVNDDIAGNVDV